MEIKPIRSEADYEAALKISKLWSMLNLARLRQTGWSAGHAG